MLVRSPWETAARIAAIARCSAEVRPNATGRRLRRGARGADRGKKRFNYAAEVDQIHVSDPVSASSRTLLARVEALEKQTDYEEN